MQARDAVAFVQLAGHLLAEEHFEAAEAAAGLAVVADRSSFRAWLALGVARARQGRHSAAIEAYLHALALDPKHVAAWCDLGELYLARLDCAQAAAAFRQVIALDPDAQHPSGRRARAVAVKTLGKLKQRTS
jgi:cytochrome c-type biogenesis protein CcmH/NrfG